jgi:F-type H+-transporting ATPase subunit b
MKKFLLTLNILLFPLILFASEEAAHGPSVKEFGYRVLTFSIFAFIIFKLLKNPVKNLLTDRTQDIAKAIEDAVKAKEEAEKELAEYKQKLDSMEKELELLKERAMKAAEAEKIEIIEEADKTIEKLKNFAESMIDSEINQAKEALRKETLELSLKLAEEKLEKTLDAKKQKELMQNYIKKIEVAN